jgi:hypothetical protein
MKTLDQIGIEKGTDKNSNGHNYLRYYDMFFTPYREKDIKLLEIGVWHGDSLRMWKEYFPNAVIVGLDIDDMKQHEEERIFTFKCKQTDQVQLHVLNKLRGAFDIIVDDGGHQSADQIATFEHYFRYLNPSGLYCIEDCLCGYSPEFVKPNDKSIISRIQEMVGDVNMGGKIDLHNLCSDKAKNPNKDWTYFEKHIEWIFVSTGLVIIKKTSDESGRPNFKRQ